jgi:hypothetical protein
MRISSCKSRIANNNGTKHPKTQVKTGQGRALKSSTVELKIKTPGAGKSEPGSNFKSDIVTDSKSEPVSDLKADTVSQSRNGQSHPSGLERMFREPEPRKGETRESFEERMRSQRRINWRVDMNDGGIYIPEITKAQALDFLSLVVDDNASSLRRLSTCATNSWWATCLQDTVSAAEEIARRAKWFGLAAAPVAGSEGDGARHAPVFIRSSGYAGMRPFRENDLLELIVNALFAWREEILDEIYPNLAPNKQAELADALRLVEIMDDRDGSVNELTQNYETGKPTKLEALALSHKAGIAPKQTL